MSFVLPGNARSLRFTGEAKALAPNSAPGSLQPGMKTAMTTLGQPRVRRPTSPPGGRILTPQGATQLTAPSPGTVVNPDARRIATPVPSSGHERRDNYRGHQQREREHQADMVPTPYMNATHEPVMRNKFASMSDDVTMALEREDVLPGAVRVQKPIVVPNAPAIPHFRAQAADPPTAIIPQPAEQEERRGAPYAVWIVASILAGLMSYHVAPALMGIFTAPRAHVQSLDP
jgi:hypothetical protein